MILRTKVISISIISIFIIFGSFFLITSIANASTVEPSSDEPTLISKEEAMRIAEEEVGGRAISVELEKFFANSRL